MIKLFANKTAFTKRLLKNKGAVFGIVIIILAVIVAMFAYFIAPDSSPFANRIIPEIANKKPGFSISLVQVKKTNYISATADFFSRFINGEED